MASSGNVFGLNEVYSLQVKNYQESNYENWPEFTPLGYGYVSGGQNPAGAPAYAYSFVSRIDHSTDIISTSAFNLASPVGGFLQSGVQSRYYGYFCAGDRGAPPGKQPITSVYRIDFNTEVQSISSNFSNDTATESAAAFSSEKYGYILSGAGGQGPTRYNKSSYISRLDFSSELVTTMVQKTPYEITESCGVFAGNYGYIAGGDIVPGYTSAISRMDLDTDVVSRRLSTLPSARARVISTGSQNYGYFSAGAIPPNTATSSTNRIDFATENINTLSNNFPTSFGNAPSTSTSSIFNGYFANEDSGTGDVYKLNYSNETISTLQRTYQFSRNGKSSVSSNFVKDPKIGFITGTYAYVIGGRSGAKGAGATCDITRFDFSTETTSTNRYSLMRTVENASFASGAFNSNYGYSAGGSIPTPSQFITSIYRIDFSNQVASLTASNLTPQIGRNDSAAVNNNTNAYFIGGNMPGASGNSSSVSKMNFSTETVSATTNFPSVIASVSSISGSPYGYITDGGVSIYRLDYSTDSFSLPGKNLSSNRNSSPTVRSSTHGYFTGGQAPVVLTTISRIEFSTETVNDPGKFLPAGIFDAAAAQNSTYGYIIGGFAGPTTERSSIQRLEFSTETASAITPFGGTLIGSTAVSDTTA